MLAEAEVQLVLDDLYRTLRGIARDTTGSYYYRPAAVFREPRHPREIEAFPAYCVYPERVGFVERLSQQRYTTEFFYAILCFGKGADDEERQKIQTRMARDVLKALEVDPHRGDDAETPKWDTRILDVRFQSLLSLSMVATRLRFKTPYRFKYGAI